MERLGLSEEQLISLAADLKKITAEVEKVRVLYGCRTLNIETASYSEPIIAVNEEIRGNEVIKHSLTDISVKEASIHIGEPTFFNVDSKIVKEN